MAKPERYPWHYSPQWNYYPPHVFNFSKLPYPTNGQGHALNSDLQENHPIRYPEPRRPYQVPYATLDYHQDNHQVHGSFMQHNSLYPKPIVHRPIPHDSSNNLYKVCESTQSYPACSNNFIETKDQSNCYQNSWKTSSQCKKKTPELDVRKFLATWQEKDDDILDVSETEENRSSHNYEAIPLDCTKRNNSDKTQKRNYDSFVTGSLSNSTGCVVQPYYIKDNYLPLNRSVISSGEMNNNNIPQRNNLNYGNHHSYHEKNYYSHSEYWKSPDDKIISCERSVPYSQQYNHCDINVNSLRSNVNYMRPKDHLMDSSDRSQYNLTASLETGDLFCDINSRNDDHHKQQLVHPIFNDAYHRPITCEEQSYFSNYNNDFPESLSYTDLHPAKEPWEPFPSTIKYKESFKNIEKHKVSGNKGSVHCQFNQSLNISSTASAGSIMYEGAFNILPNHHDSNSNLTNCVQYSDNGVLSMHTDQSSKLNSAQTLPPNKTVTKHIPGSGKIKPYQFNEEVSSDDIDISIASSGDLVVEEEHSAAGATSVISFSRSKREKININLSTKNSKTCEQINNAPKFSEPDLVDKRENSTSVPKENYSSESTVEFINREINHPLSETLENSCENTFSLKNSMRSPDQSVKSVVNVVKSVLNSPNVEEVISFPEKPDVDYLDISDNYFGDHNLEKDTKTNDETRNLSPSKCSNNDQLSTTTKLDPQSANENLPLQFTGETKCKNKKFDPDDTFISNGNLLLLAHCSQEYGCQIANKSQEENLSNIVSVTSNEKKENIDPSSSIVDVNNCKSITESETFIENHKVFETEKGEGLNSSENINKKTEITVPPLLNSEPDDFINNAKNFIKKNIGLSLPIIDDTSEECSLKSAKDTNFSNCFLNNGTVLDLKQDLDYGSQDSDMKEHEESSSITHENSNFLDDSKKIEGCTELGFKVTKELQNDSSKNEFTKLKENGDCEKTNKPVRDTVIKCSLRWDKIFNVMSDEDSQQQDMSLDLGPAKVELRMPSENCSLGQWKIVEADNKIQASSIVQVKRLILKRKSQSEERIPKMIIKKTEGQVYRSYLKNEPAETVLNCGKFKILYDIPKSKPTKNDKVVE